MFLIFFFQKFKFEHGYYYWLKVFLHNSKNGIKFLNKNEALNCNLPDKYSILNLIDISYKMNGSVGQENCWYF